MTYVREFMTICVTYDNLKILRMISNYHLIKKIDKKSNIIITIYTKHIILNMEHTNLEKVLSIMHLMLR